MDQDKPLVFVVGHVAKDINETPKIKYNSPGGGVFFGSVAISNSIPSIDLSNNLYVLTKCPEKDKSLFIPYFVKEAKIPEKNLYFYKTIEPTTCNNIYPNPNKPDERISKILTVAKPFNIQELKSTINKISSSSSSSSSPENKKKQKTKIFYLSPLSNLEFDENLIPLIKKDLKCDYIITDIQGFIRNVDLKQQKVIKKDWENKKTYLPFIDVLKCDAREASILTGFKQNEMKKSLSKIIDWGVKIIICTHQDGILIMNEKKETFESKWGKWKIEGRTGRGDTCTGSFLSSHFILKQSLNQTVQFIAKTTTKKMNYRGPLKRD